MQYSLKVEDDFSNQMSKCHFSDFHTSFSEVSVYANSYTKEREGNAAKGSDDVVNVFRVYGGKAKPNGFSWTSVNPNSVGNFRNAAGLPNVNKGRFVIEGTVKRSNIIKTRSALPLDGNKGGLLEFIIDPKNVNINRVSGANPTFK